MGEREQEQKFILKLSTVDMKGLYVMAGKEGLEPEELLEGFLSDLLGNDRSHGPDERMLAEQWLERYRASISPEETFLKYVLGEEDIGQIAEALKGLEETEAEISAIHKQLETGEIEVRGGTCTWEDLTYEDGTPCYASQEEWEKELREDLECYQEDLVLYGETLEQAWAQFSQDKSFDKEAEFEKLRAWVARMEQRTKGKGDIFETTEKIEDPIRI